MVATFDRFRPHPWHGLSAGPKPPAEIDAYIEITPLDGVAVLLSDTVFHYAKDLRQLPEAVVNRIVHYFGTYKLQMTGEKHNAIEVVGTYGAEHARAVVEASMAEAFPAAAQPG